ncbi:MAG: hypothetical protein ABW170_18920 [Candidatus Thiodiazotropha sp. L084R]
MTRTAGALIGRRRSSAFWGLGCPKTHHEIKDSLGVVRLAVSNSYDSIGDNRCTLGSKQNYISSV